DAATLLSHPARLDELLVKRPVRREPLGAGVRRVVFGAAWGAGEQMVRGDELALPLDATALDGEFDRAPLYEAADVGDVRQAAVGERRDEEPAVGLADEEVLAREPGEGFADDGGGSGISLGEFAGWDAAARRPDPIEDIGPDRVDHVPAFARLLGGHGTYLGR